MAPGPVVTACVDQLIALFNARSLDVPDGFFSRHTQLALNGVAFEQMLGRPADDPLVNLLARGAAGYRFTLKALQHAVPDAMLQRGDLVEQPDGADHIVRGQCWLSGHTRGDDAAVDILVDFVLHLRGASLVRAEAAVDPAQLARLAAARLRA